MAETKKKMVGVRSDFRSTGAGLIASERASIKAVLQIMDPIALPYDIAPSPSAALVADTMTSGRVVPMETTVAPTMISGILKRCASPVAPSTNQSPPKIRNTSPSINKMIVIAMLFTVYVFSFSSDSDLL